MGGAAAQPLIDFSDRHRGPYFLIDPRNDVHAKDDYIFFIHEKHSFFQYLCCMGHLGYAITGRILYLILDIIGATVEEI